MTINIYLIIALLALLAAAPLAVQAADSSSNSRQWPAAKAREWYQAQPWPCGFNYVPSNAISYTEMFMPYNFDPAKMDREMEEAQKVGFNCARIVLPFVVWEHDPAVFKRELSEFLNVCDKHHIKVMPALFDDCVFGPISDPVYGPQPDVVPGWYANGWTPSPGHAIVRDPAQWPRLAKYVTDIMTTFKSDKRILLWDLYNEPTNGGMGDVTIPLVDKVFDWARAVNPTQPLTVDVFGDNAMQKLALDRSDIVTFHNYDGPQALGEEIARMKKSGRPVICTEWLNRPAGSTVAGCLPLFAAEDVGCISWGLVNGRTQTDLPWGHRPGDPPPALWQHDLFHADFTPYDPQEIALFKRFLRKRKPLRPNAGK